MLRTSVTAYVLMSHRYLCPCLNHVSRILLIPSWVTDISNPTHPACPQRNSWPQSVPSVWSCPSVLLYFAQIIPSLVLDLSSVTTSSGNPLLPGQILLFHSLGTMYFAFEALFCFCFCSWDVLSPSVDSAPVVNTFVSFDSQSHSKHLASTHCMRCDQTIRWIFK